MVLCAVEDLLFSSKIRGVAKERGVHVRFVRSPDALNADLAQSQPQLVVLDLNADRLRPLEMVRVLREHPECAAVPVIGFVSHVQEDRIAAARAAGVSQVMARSAFFAQLPSLLQAPA